MKRIDLIAKEYLAPLLKKNGFKKKKNAEMKLTKLKIFRILENKKYFASKMFKIDIYILIFIEKQNSKMQGVGVSAYSLMRF